MIEWYNGIKNVTVTDKNYKKPKIVDDQVHYLSEYKNVVFEEMSEEKGKELLLKRNYINLITPFKHEFARKKEGSRFECERDEYGSHIYDNKTDIFLYSCSYEDERSRYNEYYDGISKFESAFKSTVGHFFLTKYNIRTRKRAYDAFEIIINRVDNLKISSSQGEESVKVRKKQMKKSLIKLRDRLRDRKYADKTVEGQDIYIMFDRAGLPDILNIFLTLRGKEQVKIFDQMKEWNLDLKSINHKEFAEKVFNLGAIRNCVMHFNSITILLKYTDDTKKELRGVASTDRYESILKSLVYISKECSR